MVGVVEGEEKSKVVTFELLGEDAVGVKDI